MSGSPCNKRKWSEKVRPIRPISKHETNRQRRGQWAWSKQRKNIDASSLPDNTTYRKLTYQRDSCPNQARPTYRLPCFDKVCDCPPGFKPQSSSILVNNHPLPQQHPTPGESACRCTAPLSASRPRNNSSFHSPLGLIRIYPAWFFTLISG